MYSKNQNSPHYRRDLNKMQNLIMGQKSNSVLTDNLILTRDIKQIDIDNIKSKMEQKDPLTLNGKKLSI